MTCAGIWLSHRTASQRRQRNPRYQENQDEVKKAKVPCLIQSPASLHLYVLSSSKKTCIVFKSLNSESPLKIKKTRRKKKGIIDTIRPRGRVEIRLIQSYGLIQRTWKNVHCANAMFQMLFLNFHGKSSR